MAKFPSFALVLHARPLKDGRFSLALRVTYLGKSKFFFLSKHCLREQWNAETRRFEKSFPDARKENDILLNYERRASDAIRDMERDGIAFSFDRFERSVFGTQQAGGAKLLSEYISEIASDLLAAGKIGNARVYLLILSSAREFKAGATLSDLDGGWLSRFEKWATAKRSLSGGGLSVHLRTLRAVCRKAIKEGIMPEVWDPFRNYSLAHLKTGKAKKSAGLDFIRALEAVEPSSNAEQFARDLFLFSFYTRGMNLADIAELKPENIRGGRVVYSRKKTGRPYSVGLSEKALAIVAKYAGGVYLFPIFTGEKKTPLQLTYRRRWKAAEINKALRAIASSLGFDIPGLSFYTARHTYADSLKKKGVSVEVISEALGHADIRTTDSYLKSFGDDVIDAADRLLD